jgi:hypothetical protein
VALNELGLRESSMAGQLEFPTRVLLLGDSFTLGLGVAAEQSFAHLLQERLNGQGVGVVNCGHSGYAAVQEKHLGLVLLEPVRPRLVVQCIFAWNDVPADSRARYRDVEVRFGLRLSKSRLLPLGPLDFVRTRSYLWRFVQGRMARVLSERVRPDGSGQDVAERVQPTLGAILELRDHCRRNDILFGVVLIPPKQALAGTTFDHHLHAVLGGRGVPVLNLGLKGFELSDYYGNDGHWNEHGHVRAARHIRPFIESLIAAPAASHGADGHAH